MNDALRFRPDDLRRAKALAMRLAGLSYRQIGKEFGFSRQRAQQLIRPSIAVRSEVRMAANRFCQKCGRPCDEGDTHHANCTWWEPGKYNHISNLQYLCPACHRKAHTS
jgi:5-methylcytosine-specific restriction endonuclease McrA